MANTDGTTRATMASNDTGLLIVGHGSRRTEANEQLEHLVERYRQRRPDWNVHHGYVELADPPFEQALDDLASASRRVVLAPLFLFAAGHVKNDIPLALSRARRRWPSVRFEAARALGVHPSLADVVYERACDTGAMSERNAGETAVIVVGRGSSDPDANADFCKLARIVGEGRDLGWVWPCFAGVTRPGVPETLNLAARARPGRVVVVPYLMFRGRLIEQLGEHLAEFGKRHPWVRTELAEPIGPDEALLDVLDERVREVRANGPPLPCDNCHYRRPVGGVADNVGGLRALLWSARHTVTHSQARPHAHAHKPLRKHVLVCGNVDCADRGSIRLVSELRRRVKRAGKQREVRVTKTSCLGRCGEGPTVAVYPDGVWYRGVQEQDADELVRDHVLGDRLVARLVDNIMQ